jgi:inhibitor of KinA
MTLTPLGDQAVLAYFPTEASAIHFAASIRSAAPAWLQDVVPAYASVGVFFDADAVSTGEVFVWLQAFPAAEPPPDLASEARLFHIPVCYEMQLDLPRVCENTGLIEDDVIRLHGGTTYTVYAIGFVPGFPYLGYLPPALSGVGRLASPRVRVDPGSVGLTGRQTGIYPLPRPGGWNLIGRTPLTIVDVAAGFFPLRVGDRVRFERIDERRYRELEGERVEAETTK